MANIVENLTLLAVEDLETSRRLYIDKLGFSEYLRPDG